MPRTPTLLLLAGVLAAVGCRSFRLCDANEPAPAARSGPYSNIPYSHTPAAASGSCLPCSGAGATYPGGMTLGTPTVVGGGYAVPMTYPSSPTLGTPTYPGGDGTPYRPRRDDELPLPGGYSQPGAAEMGRGVAPKPPTALPTGK